MSQSPPPYNSIAIQANSVPCLVGSSYFNQILLDPTFRVIYDRACRVISCTDSLAFRFNPTGQLPILFHNFMHYVRPEHQQHLLDIPYDTALTQSINHYQTTMMMEVARSSKMHVRHLDLVDYVSGYAGYIAYVTTIRVACVDGTQRILYDCVFRPRYQSLP